MVSRKKNITIFLLLFFNSRVPSAVRYFLILYFYHSSLITLGKLINRKHQFDYVYQLPSEILAKLIYHHTFGSKIMRMIIL